MSTPDQHDPAFTSAMREVSRSHIAEIWRRGQSGESLSAEDQTYYDVMCLHPEYQEIWEHAAEFGDRDVTIDGANPFLHVSMHTVVENQIAERNPPETEQTLFRLMQAGLDRHEATHRIAAVISEMMWEMLRQRKTFDRPTYLRRLRQLSP